MNRARVLVIHDAPAIRHLVSHALESRGCTAIGIEDCRTATGLSILDPPDVVVADERMIDADPEAFRALRRRFPKTIVVALTAPMRLRTRSDLQGVDCAVEKPPDPEQLLRAVHWALQLTRRDASDALA